MCERSKETIVHRSIQRLDSRAIVMLHPRPQPQRQTCIALIIILLGSSVESFPTKTTAKTNTILANEMSIDDDLVLCRYQQEVAAPIADSFLPGTFNPVPWLSNCHVQTIAANFFRHVPECNYYAGIPETIGGILSSPKPLDSFWDKRERIDTPDGDWFHVDYKFTRDNSSSKGMVVLLHGLESNSDSKLSRDMTNAYLRNGFDVACLNFRGCCGEANDLLGGYHLGFTQDLLHFMRLRKHRSTEMPRLYLSGFSLGANVILKALGELGMKAPQEYNICGAAALCVPFDAERNAPFLGRAGFNQAVYCENLLRTLRQRAQLQLKIYCNDDQSTDKFDYKGVMKAKTITDFDEAFVAKIYGFDSAIDYYRKTSCIHFLEHIAVPTLILNARDDPFMDPDHFPVHLTHKGGGRAPIQMVGTKHGGHLGYVFHQVESNDAVLGTSWPSTELARFFQHVHSQHEICQ